MKRKPLHPNDPLLHSDHSRPKSRRDFLRYGMLAGSGAVLGPSVLGLLASRPAHALSPEVRALIDEASCSVGTATGNNKAIPFICFDLAGGANITGSNVLGGGPDGQLDFISSAGYSLQGLPGDMVPSASATPDTQLFSDELGLIFHADSGFLRGIREKAPTATGNINGAIIPARSDNDTGNNPHNPMYAIHRVGQAYNNAMNADAPRFGQLLGLIGSRSTDSGGNSIAPPMLVDPTLRPTKIDRPSDATGLVDTGKLVGLLNQPDAVATMETMARISDLKLNQVSTQLPDDETIKYLVKCGYVKSADLAEQFGNPSDLDPDLDADIVGPGGIFSEEEWTGRNRGEYQKTASVMKLVVNRHAGAGTITMGGFDYHTGDRATGEFRDLRAGRCIGACLEYAALKGQPLMVYVFSDGSVFSNGMTDDSEGGGGKGVWTGDNSGTAASFFLVYNPNGKPQSTNPLDANQGTQIGYFRPDGSVETGSSPAANNVNLLVNTVALNYMALHDEYSGAGLGGNDFASLGLSLSDLLPNHGLGNDLGQLIAMRSII